MLYQQVQPDFGEENKDGRFEWIVDDVPMKMNPE